MPSHIHPVARSPSTRPATVATSIGCSAAISAAVPPSTPRGHALEDQQQVAGLAEQRDRALPQPAAPAAATGAAATSIAATRMPASTVKRQASTVIGSAPARAVSSAPTKPELHSATSPIDAITIATGPSRPRDASCSRGARLGHRVEYPSAADPRLTAAAARTARAAYVSTTRMGSVVGASEPPSGSTVTPTAAPAVSAPSSRNAVASPLASKVPALCGPSASMYQAW